MLGKRTGLLALGAIALVTFVAMPVAGETQQTITRARNVADAPCPEYVLGVPDLRWPWAPVGCDTFIAAAVVSTAIDATPEQRRDAIVVLERLLEHSLLREQQHPFRSMGNDTIEGKRITRSVLYRGFVLLQLAGLERLSPNNRHSAFYDALARATARDVMRTRTHFLATYRGKIWPCDSAPLASALTLHGKHRHDAGTARAADVLVSRMLALRATDGGFPTRITSSGHMIERDPRGTVLAWTAGFLVHGRPDAARAFADDLFENFCDRRGPLALCREWPRGSRRGMDAVSGPVVMGYGVGATALARAASRARDGDDWGSAIERSERAFGIDVMRAHEGRFAFEGTIDAWARTAKAW